MLELLQTFNQPFSGLKKTVWSVDVRLNPAALFWSVAQITSYLNYKLRSAAS